MGLRVYGVFRLQGFRGTYDSKGLGLFARSYV